MTVRLTPAGALDLLRVTGVHIGIEGQLVTGEDITLSDDVIILLLQCEFGFESSCPVRDAALIRETARLWSYVERIDRERRYLVQMANQINKTRLHAAETLKDSQLLRRGCRKRLSQK